MATTSNYALRLLVSLKTEAEKVAAEEGTTLSQFINVAVAEKLAVLRTARYFEERAARAKPGAFDRLMKTAGDEPPRPLATRSCRRARREPTRDSAGGRIKGGNANENRTLPF